MATNSATDRPKVRDKVKGEFSPSSPFEEEVIRLLEKNIRLSHELLKFNKKISRWIFWQRVRGWLYFALIVVPLIFASFYLPPLLKNLFQQYNQVLKTQIYSPYLLEKGAYQSSSSLKNKK